jgi:gamma-glutamyltranspeptidase
MGCLVEQSLSRGVKNMSDSSIRRRASVVAIIVLFMVTMVQPIMASTRNPEVRAANGMVAAAHPLAAEAGIEILKAGGNIVDAAVATAFAVGVVEPMASNLSPEGVMLIYLADTKETVAIDYRCEAPRATALALEGTEAPQAGLAIHGCAWFGRRPQHGS